VQCTSGTVLTVDGTASESDPANFTVNGFSSAAGTTCTATETVVPSGYTSSATCSATLAVGSCTITNIANTATFTVLKDFTDNNPAGVGVNVVCDSGSVSVIDPTASEASPASFGVSAFGSAAGTTCRATETSVPNGYSSSGSCSATLASGSCTITNTLNTASFVVTKDFTDGNPADVPIGLTCTSGSIVDTDPTASVSDPANFTVLGFSSIAPTSCTATETAVPASYSSSGPCTATLIAGSCGITNTPVVQVAGLSTVRLISSVQRRALVAGEFVRLSGKDPGNCGPVLRIDGLSTGPVSTSRDGTFDLSVGTRDLAAGRHVAEVVCTKRDATLVRKTFWIAAPISSSNILFVAMAALLVLFAIGWVALRSIAGGSVAATAAKPQP
jgi:hypothetical protein